LTKIADYFLANDIINYTHWEYLWPAFGPTWDNLPVGQAVLHAKQNYQEVNMQTLATVVNWD